MMTFSHYLTVVRLLVLNMFLHEKCKKCSVIGVLQVWLKLDMRTHSPCRLAAGFENLPCSLARPTASLLAGNSLNLAAADASLAPIADNLHVPLQVPPNLNRLMADVFGQDVGYGASVKYVSCECDVMLRRQQP